jgi:hypothetical protein
MSPPSPMRGRRSPPWRPPLWRSGRVKNDFAFPLLGKAAPQSRMRGGVFVIARERVIEVKTRVVKPFG